MTAACLLFFAHGRVFAAFSHLIPYQCATEQSKAPFANFADGGALRDKE